MGPNLLRMKQNLALKCLKDVLEANLKTAGYTGIEKSTVFTCFKGFIRVGGTPKKFHGTLMCRGTPVEKHCPKNIWGNRQIVEKHNPENNLHDKN